MRWNITKQLGMAGQSGLRVAIEDDGPGPRIALRRLAMIAGLVAPFLLAAVIALPSFQQAHHPDATQDDATEKHLIAPGVMMVGRPTTVSVKPVTTDALTHVPGKSVTVEIVEFQPGARSPEHHHGGSVTVYVLAGTVRSQLAGSPPMVYHAGQSFFEPMGAVHLFAENPSPTEVARIMAIHVADTGAQLTTFH